MKNNFFDFGVDRSVTRKQVIDRGHKFMLDYFDAIDKYVQFNNGDIGLLAEIGEDNHDYWIRVVYDGKDVLESPLSTWKIVG